MTLRQPCDLGYNRPHENYPSQTPTESPGAVWRGTGQPDYAGRCWSATAAGGDRHAGADFRADGYYHLTADPVCAAADHGLPRADSLTGRADAGAGYLDTAVYPLDAGHSNQALAAAAPS